VTRPTPEAAQREARAGGRTSDRATRSPLLNNDDQTLVHTLGFRNLLIQNDRCCDILAKKAPPKAGPSGNWRAEVRLAPQSTALATAIFKSGHWRVKSGRYPPAALVDRRVPGKIISRTAPADGRPGSQPGGFHLRFGPIADWEAV
jgi:hypothetical protein